MFKTVVLIFELIFGGFYFQVGAQTTDYEAMKVRIKERQQKFRTEYQKGDSVTRNVVVKQAEQYLFNIITDSIFVAWYNTPWDFNGTTQVPKKGKIACGYFVSTVLRDAGFNVPRVKWGQLDSEGMIKRTSKQIKRFSNKPVEDVIDYINKTGNGLYIVGLDCHVGFIYKRDEKLRFVHSSYYYKSIGVMSEQLKGRNPLNDSKYRVIGKILDEDMIAKWIMNEKYD